MNFMKKKKRKEKAFKKVATFNMIYLRSNVENNTK